MEAAAPPPPPGGGPPNNLPNSHNISKINIDKPRRKKPGENKDILSK